jgi:two-component sensor histidine kinase
MIFILTPVAPALAVRACRVGICFGSLLVLPAQAAEKAAPAPAGYLWTGVWVLVLLVVIFLAYRHQNRMVEKKTAELRRELFERQIAEKELLASEQKLRRSLAEKEALLKEIHHRVKNNLQIVSSLLYLQENDLNDTKGIEILRESQNRVKSMALVHEQLYSTEDLAKIDFGRYVQELAANLFDAYGIDQGRIRLDIRAEDIDLEIDTAVPCGLIVNELVSNALKHAFPSESGGNVEVLIRMLDASRMEIAVADDGTGLAAPHTDTENQSLGLRLVDTLTAQLDGTLRVVSEKGTRFSIIVTLPGQR